MKGVDLKSVQLLGSAYKEKVMFWYLLLPPYLNNIFFIKVT